MGILKNFLGAAAKQFQQQSRNEYIIIDLGHDYELEVAGENHHYLDIEALVYNQGIRLDDQESTVIDVIEGYIAREPNNEFDRNAVRVYVAGQWVGYLASEDAARYSGALNLAERYGHIVHVNARVWVINDHGIHRARITLHLPGVAQIRDAMAITKDRGPADM